MLVGSTRLMLTLVFMTVLYEVQFCTAFFKVQGSRHMAHCSYCPNAAASASPASRLRRMPRPGPLVASRTTSRLKAYEGALPPYDRTKRMVIPDTLEYVSVGLPSRSWRVSCMCVWCWRCLWFCRVLRLQPGHRYCLLGQLSKEVGWNYADTIRVSYFIVLFLQCSLVASVRLLPVG